MINIWERKQHQILGGSARMTWLLLRLGVCMEFVGNGAFGVITKEGWLPYFAVWGIPEPLAWKLMPVVGTIDIILGVMALVTPRKGFLLFMAAWGLMTACLRPLAGEPISELLERAYNYGVPLAGFLMIAWDSKTYGWWQPVEDIPFLSTERFKLLRWVLRVTISVYLVGHGLFGAIDGKAGLATHYDVTGISALFGSTDVAMMAIGRFEILLGFTVLFLPVTPLLLFVCIWKIFSESLFISSGAYFGIFEFIERGASMVAPLALHYIQQELKYRSHARMNRAIQAQKQISE